MKTISLAAILVVIFAVPILAQKSGIERIDPTRGVHDAFDRLVDGIRQTDINKVMSVYENTDRLLIFNNNGSATQGWDNVKNNVTATYAKAFERDARYYGPKDRNARPDGGLCHLQMDAKAGK